MEEEDVVDELGPTWPKEMYGGYGTLEKLDMYQTKPRETLDDNKKLDPDEVSPPPPPPIVPYTYLF